MELFDYDNLVNHLKNLSNEDKLIICSRSYKHPNGFVKIVLKYNEDGSCIRIHYWLKELVMEQNYHNHGWCFVSKIINGSLKNITYSKCESNNLDTYNEYILDLTKHNKKINITKSNIKYDLIQNSEQIYNKNDIYHLEPDVIHKAYHLEENTITIIKQESLSKTSCNIYTQTDISNEHVYENISLFELNNVIDIIIKMLS